ncbi:MAG: DUF5615 family PIN-like protein [Acidobacteria bacterium]|nr:DUF5615 family PIN-like protein [Acidobacteriota bacterium]
MECLGLLRAAGWDASTVHEEGLSGTEDARISTACQAEDRVLFTLD